MRCQRKQPHRCRHNNAARQQHAGIHRIPEQLHRQRPPYSHRRRLGLLLARQGVYRGDNLVHAGTSRQCETANRPKCAIHLAASGRDPFVGRLPRRFAPRHHHDALLCHQRPRCLDKLYGWRTRDMHTRRHLRRHHHPLHHPLPLHQPAVDRGLPVGHTRLDTCMLVSPLPQLRLHQLGPYPRRLGQQSQPLPLSLRQLHLIQPRIIRTPRRPTTSSRR